jgi:hypothetical protein
MNSFDKNALFPLTAAFMRRFATVVVDIPDPDEILDLLGVQIGTPARELFKVLMTEGSAGWVNPMPLGPAIVRDAWNFATTMSPDDPATNERALLHSLELFALPQYVGLHSDKFDALKKRLVECMTAAAEADADLDKVFRGLQGGV